MKLPSILLLLLGFPLFSFAEIDSVQNQIITIDDHGISPSTVTLSRGGTSVFFLNSTSDSALEVDIDYGKRLAYCASATMEMGKDGVFRSKTPFQPQHFVAACFPEPGTYEIHIRGRNPKGVVEKASVEVSK
jgi:hypothetical protein